MSVVLFLPGLDGTGRLLFRQTELLANYEVRSEIYPQDREVTYAELADRAAEQLVESGISGPVPVVTESFGGAVAIQFARRHPQLVERLLMINTFALYPEWWLVRPGGFLSQFLPSKPAHRVTRRLRSFFFFAPDVPQAIRDACWEVTSDVPLAAMGRRLRMLSRVDLRAELPQIRVPTVVLAAPNDRVVSPACGREIARRLPLARLIEPPVGHAALLHPTVNIRRMLEDTSLWP